MWVTNNCCIFAAWNQKWTTMKDYTNKEAALKSVATGTGAVEKEFFTADEAITFLEPRIRSMFKWKKFFYRKSSHTTWYAFYEELEAVYSIDYLGNNHYIGHLLDINL